MGHLLCLRPGILLLQESKIVDEQKVVEAKAWCLARIMNIQMSQSTSSAKGGENTDTDIAWSRHLDVAGVPKTWLGADWWKWLFELHPLGCSTATLSMDGLGQDGKSRTSLSTMSFAGLC